MPDVVDGPRWITERLKFLRARLADGPSDEERHSIEAEIETLLAERRQAVPGLLRGFPRLPRFRRTPRR